MQTISSKVDDLNLNVVNLLANFNDLTVKIEFISEIKLFRKFAKKGIYLFTCMLSKSAEMSIQD